MKKLLFSSYVALAIFGCGGDQGELPDIFALSSSDPQFSSSSFALLSSSSIRMRSSSSAASSIIYDLPVEYGGKTYITVKIGNQIWFQQDLEYGDVALYDWETARTACPSGWHLPTVEDWDTLMYSVDPLSKFGPHLDMEISSNIAGTYLKAASGWNYNGNGEDKYGFMAIPSGDEIGDYGKWWSATVSDEEFAYSWWLYSKEQLVTWYDSHISELFSVRCLKDK